MARGRTPDRALNRFNPIAAPPITVIMAPADNPAREPDLLAHRTLLDSLPQAVSVVDSAGVARYANPAGEEIIADLRARADSRAAAGAGRGTIAEDGSPLSRAELPVEITRLSGRECDNVCAGFPDAEGRVRWLRISTRRLGEGDGPHWVLASLHDVTEARETALALRRATQQFQSAFDNASIGMALVGLEGQWLQVNQALCELVGYSERELLCRTFQDLTHPDDLDADLALVQDVLAGRRATYQMYKRYLRSDGRVIWALLSVSLATDEAGRPLHFISQIQDVTERRELEEQLRHQAEQDPLTGLANRRRFEQDLERQIERCARHGERAALAVIDLDRFKRVNDMHGHATGDRLLAAVGAALQARRRATDVAARIGGDEFAFILIGVDEHGAATAAAGITAAIAEHARAAGLDVTASVGVAMIAPGVSADELFVRADGAMYEAKRTARAVLARVA